MSVDSFVLHLAESLELSLNECSEDALKICISLLEHRITYLENEEKQQLYLNEQKNLIAEFEGNLNWLNFSVKEKRVEFISLIIRKELKKSNFVYDENLDFNIQVVCPNNLTEDDSAFILKAKNNPFNIRIKSTSLFSVFYPLLNKHKIEYLNSLIAQEKPKTNFLLVNDEPSTKEKNKENRTLILKNLEKLYQNGSLKKCFKVLKDNDFINFNTTSDYFKEAFSGTMELSGEKIIWIGSPSELNYFITNVFNGMKHLPWKRATYSFKYNDSEINSETLRKTEVKITNKRKSELNEAVIHLNPNWKAETK
jgi:hypothetical protein